MSGRSLRTRRELTSVVSTSTPASSTRPRRGAAAQHAARTTIERSSPDESRIGSIRLTVKSDPKQLRDATSGTPTAIGRRNVSGTEARSTRAKRPVVEESSEEEDEEEEDEGDEEEEEDDEEDEDAEGDEDDEGDVDMDEDDEDEDADAEGDEDETMIDVPEPLPLPASGRPISKPSTKVTPASRVELPSVEEKEMAMDDDDDDDELSSLDDDEDLEGGEDDMGAAVEGNRGQDEDDEDEEEEDEEEEEEEAEDVGADSEDDGLSRSQTPDPTKLTRRQRADHGDLMALSNEAQKKKHLTAEEISMRRVEMARRRKNLSEKRNEEEKLDTINRLLKKQAPKRRRKAEIEADRIAEEGGAGAAGASGDGEDAEVYVQRAGPVYSRYLSTRAGPVLAVPDGWVEAGYGCGVFGAQGVKEGDGPWSGKMVEVVE